MTVMNFIIVCFIVGAVFTVFPLGDFIDGFGWLGWALFGLFVMVIWSFLKQDDFLAPIADEGESHHF
tara:strand:+ start:126 stop:326 length:201 start_codon:yes stop_codon:yes gene_type:complete